jgi:DNA-binding CsgD family transcriptional regulator
MRKIGPVEIVVGFVCEITGVKSVEIYGEVRWRNVTKARHLAMWACVRALGLPFAHVGRALGRDHTTVLNGVRRIEQFLKDGDQDWIKYTQTMVEMLEGGASRLPETATAMQRMSNARLHVAVATTALAELKASVEAARNQPSLATEERIEREEHGGWTRKSLALQNARFAEAFMRAQLEEAMDETVRAMPDSNAGHVAEVCVDRKDDERIEKRLDGRARRDFYGQIIEGRGREISQPRWRTLTDREKRRARLMWSRGLTQAQIRKCLTVNTQVAQEYLMELQAKRPRVRPGGTPKQNKKGEIINLRTSGMPPAEICRHLHLRRGQVNGVLWRAGLMGKKDFAALPVMVAAE